MITAQTSRLVILAGVVLAAVAQSVMVERVEGTLHYTASISKPTYMVEEVVDTILTVKNAGSTPVSITFPSARRFDFVVRKPQGDEVWRWSYGRVFIQEIRTIALNPQETLTFRAGWDQRDLQGRRVDPGAYEVIAIFTGRVEGRERTSVQMPPLAFTIATSR